jgi:leucyl aminopeptidase
VARIVCYLSKQQLKKDQQPVPLLPVNKGNFEDWKSSASPVHRQWAENSGFTAAAGQSCGLPGTDGELEAYLVGVKGSGFLYSLSSHASRLPPGTYRLEVEWSREERIRASLGWGLALYRFDRYKSNEKQAPSLVLDADVDEAVRSLYAAQCLVRDLHGALPTGGCCGE